MEKLLHTTVGRPGLFHIAVHNVKNGRIVSWDVLKNENGVALAFETEAAAIAYIDDLEGGLRYGT